MSNSGAKAALRGYRLQTLYILNEILRSESTDLVFQPEGNEDLAVYKGKQLVRAIQVKAYSEPLVLSHFIKPDQEDSFFHRSAKLLCLSGNVKVEVISFGDIGKELKNAWMGAEPNKNSVLKKLVNHGMTEQQVNSMFERITWNKVSEFDLNIDINRCLSNSLTVGSPVNALSLLTAWLYTASEQQTKITYSQLIEKINSIGKYLSEREAHHTEWFKSLEPLIESEISDTLALENEFYKGVSTRFSHIQANLDIERTEQLDKIDELFKQNQTVIIHAASGQGKTSLAYRYLYNFIPENWRLKVNFIEDRGHAKSVALAIADHLAAFNAKLYLYIDVSPRDLDWTSLVKSLLDHPNIKILLTIREEDLARQNISNEEIGSPALLRLQFTKKEAKHIYQNLITKKVAKPYPSFEQAWLSFGGNGSLLEYIYFLTQTESLVDKLTFQVKRLRCEVREGRLEPKAITLLLACAVATAYESKLKIDLLVDEISLNDPIGTFDLFEDEYLIRRSNDKLHIEALHPIRSRILVNVLADPIFSPWITSALSVMPCLEETDLETFLLYSFSEKPNDFSLIFNQLSKLTVNSWATVAGIGRALLWFGIYRHAIENKDIIESSRILVGNDAWAFMLLPDIGGAMKTDPVEGFISLLGQNNPIKRNEALKLRSEISSSEIVYEDIKKWLVQLNGEFIRPKNDRDWSGLGEILLWLGKLKINPDVEVTWLIDIDIENSFASIESLADLVIGIYYFDKSLYQKFILKNEVIIERLFQESTQTIWLEKKPDNPIAHYIIPEQSLNDEGHLGSTLNEFSVLRATLLRKLFPDKERFGARGYGHQNIFMELPIDESNKPSILKSYIPIEQFVNMNSTWANYADYIHRPADWLEYANNIILVREQIVDGLVCLNKTLNSYFKKLKSQALIGEGKIESKYWEALSLVNWQITKLPKLAVDQWGMTSEGTLNGSEETRSNQINFLMMQEYSKTYQKSLSNYIHSISNFFSQSHIILIINGLIGRLPLEQHQIYYEKAEEIGHPCNEHTLHLATMNFNDAHNHLEIFQKDFRDHFQEILDPVLLEKLEKKEHEKFKKSWPLWYQFAYNPENHWKDLPEVRASSIADRTQKELLQSIKYSLTNSLPEDLKGYVLSESLKHEGQKALWIGIEVNNLSSLGTILKAVIDALTEAIRPMQYKDLKYYSMSNQWDNFVIVPMRNGNTFSNLAWFLLANSFVGDTPVLDEDKFFLHIPRPLNKEAIEHFNFKTNNIAYFTELSSIEENISHIFNVVNYVHCFNELTPNLDDVGIKILQTYLSPLMIKVTSKITQVSKVIYQVRKDSADELLREVLNICANAVKPGDLFEDQSINISDSYEWAQLLSEALTELQLYKWQNLFK
ncbi:hypothetical protein [Pseudoalteromonas fuliginea]|uniref:ATP-binding protein n=1 Tax=Pseudoalteromonas fuliginea TaxID=1872678 RepID=A0ABQ6RF10_9GAMM|nr:hypothetical protein [Pseudoalteromonas fuliginea]KAA1152094.1 hypothetical protein EU509_14960 [Pseudoalteromonas fuliginea]KAA1166191.1 hypothetical protein EUZ79_14950 [Pseudoalteromonas fuliginea]